MGDNQGDGTAARRLNAIRSYRFKPSENMLSEETVFLLGQIDSRDAALREKDAEIERLCLAIGGLRAEIEDQGRAIEQLTAALADKERETIERCAQLCEQHAARSLKGIILAPEFAGQFEDDGDELLPMLPDNGPAAIFANELGKIRLRFAASGIRALRQGGPNED